MNTADLITSFFNNEMSPDQERQFLLSVASSDSLRLGLKSHVMLDKILNEQAGKARISSGVRANVMKEAALVAAAAGSFATEEALAQKESVVKSSVADTKSQSTIARRVPHWASGALVMLLSVGSFFVGYYSNEELGEQETQRTLPVTSTPVDQQTLLSTEVSLQDQAVLSEEPVQDVREKGIEENVTQTNAPITTSGQSQQHTAADLSDMSTEVPDQQNSNSRLTTTVADTASDSETDGPNNVSLIMGRRSTQELDKTDTEEE